MTVIARLLPILARSGSARHVVRDEVELVLPGAEVGYLLLEAGESAGGFDDRPADE